MTTPAPHPPAPTPHQPSFARRHPILTGFGVLAGLTLFATYFPISAIVTAVIVGAHATGTDRLALRLAERGFSWLRARLPHQPAAPAPPSLPDPPGPSQPSRSLGQRGASLQRERRTLRHTEGLRHERQTARSERERRRALGAGARRSGVDLDR